MKHSNETWQLKNVVKKDDDLKTSDGLYTTLKTLSDI